MFLNASVQQVLQAFTYNYRPADDSQIKVLHCHLFNYLFILNIVFICMYANILSLCPSIYKLGSRGCCVY